MEASLCLVAGERPQWPRGYSLGRPRSHGHMPSLVGDSDQVLGVLDWALTRMRNLLLILVQSNLSILRAADKHDF